MKKIYSLIFAFAVVLTVTAQTRLEGSGTPSIHVSTNGLHMQVDASRSPGATLSWYERCNPAYRDGYKVLATSNPSFPVTNTDFVDPPFYTRTDATSPSPTYATDTIWVLKTVSIPATYNGMPIYIAYHHDAN